ncbi:uncharacterized protein LACBIDRAFT_294571, partial [Laccaria bicolor S238N-H82]
MVDARLLGGVNVWKVDPRHWRLSSASDEDFVEMGNTGYHDDQPFYILETFIFDGPSQEAPLSTSYDAPGTTGVYCGTITSIERIASIPLLLGNSDISWISKSYDAPRIAAGGNMIECIIFDMVQEPRLSFLHLVREQCLIFHLQAKSYDAPGITVDFPVIPIVAAVEEHTHVVCS